MKKIKNYKNGVKAYLIYITLTGLIFVFSPKDSVISNLSFGGIIMLSMLLPYFIALCLVDKED
ncbi:hypothetical protein [Pectobacterium aroidearum]|uniref:hypothetical protein n=1 Tax=Pectobacterium aroidearum TaxID=1201031 RepID=UPI00211423C3|nr:hypothetical protein [Pectobacterium aroidearum]UUE58996.1 hypothetical protein L0Y27_06875 [Pectobacterium aroidearum]UUE71823.1 hypothetical protein L0Y21_07545 [Pectobacterium aroidearum]